jgi:soluble lytic murein transglycosylase-like protein
LIQKGFSDMMRLNKMARFCFTLAFLVALLPRLDAADMERVRTTVRVDRGSGRLIRTQLIAPREVPALEVVAREAAFAPKPVAGSPVKPSSKAYPEVDLIVDEAAAVHGVDPLLARSVLQVESNYNQYALSPKGAMGYMQLMPATAKQLGVSNAFDARQNIEGGVRFLRYLKSKFDDDRLVLAAYNAGEAAVKKHGWIPPYPETIDYVYKVGRKYGEAKRAQAPVVPKPAPAKALPKIAQTVDADGRIHIDLP